MPLAFEASDNSDFDLDKKEVRVDFADDRKLPNADLTALYLTAWILIKVEF